MASTSTTTSNKGGGGGTGITFDPGMANGDLGKKLANTLEKVTGIPESLIVANHALTSFTNDAGVQEKGVSLVNFNLNWAYNRNTDDPGSQEIAPMENWINPILASLRTQAVVMAPAMTISTVFTFSGIGDDGTVLAGTSTVYFRSKRYWGISGSVLTTDAQVLAALSGEFGTSKAVTKTFDASAGSQYLYFCYPTTWGAPSGTLFGGFEFSDYAQSTIVNFTNASGHSEDYYLLRTNNTYNGASLSWGVY